MSESWFQAQTKIKCMICKLGDSTHFPTEILAGQHGSLFLRDYTKFVRTNIPCRCSRVCVGCQVHSFISEWRPSNQKLGQISTFDPRKNWGGGC